mgnify:CR=1 FL=1
MGRRNLCLVVLVMMITMIDVRYLIFQSAIASLRKSHSQLDFFQDLKSLRFVFFLNSCLIVKNFLRYSVCLG